MNSLAACSKRARSGGGWLAVGTEASREAALIRTPRTGSASSGEASGQIWLAGTFSSTSSALIRTIGSGSARPSRAVVLLVGEMRVARSSIALARATAGAFLSAAKTPSRAAASAWSLRAA